MKHNQPTIGRTIWNIGFTIFYPVVSIFTATFALVLQLFSLISQGLFLVLNNFGKDKA